MGPFKDSSVVNLDDVNVMMDSVIDTVTHQ
jgi:hypothetical protein